jgi:hypothetical protein
MALLSYHVRARAREMKGREGDPQEPSFCPDTLEGPRGRRFGGPTFGTNFRTFLTKVSEGGDSGQGVKNREK